MRHAEANLDAFWAQVDRTMSNRSGTAVGRLLAKPRLLKRTPEWSPTPKTGEPARSVQDLARPLSELYLDLEQRTSRKPSETTATTSRKGKLKTRGTPHDPAQIDDPNQRRQQRQPSTAATTTEPINAVDARALKVFRTHFLRPGRAARSPGPNSCTPSSRWASRPRSCTGLCGSLSRPLLTPILHALNKRRRKK